MHDLRLCVLADLHGHLPVVPPCDLVLIAGDLCPDDTIADQATWLDGPFRWWLSSLRARGVIGVAGNHDGVYERGRAPDDLPWAYLQDEATFFDGLLVWGTPWQPPFADWYFNAPEDVLAAHYQRIPQKTDIVIAHGPPHGVLDGVRERNVGSTALADAVERVRPGLLVCGHVHEGRGAARMGPTLVVNAALRDAHFSPRHQPMRVRWQEGRATMANGEPRWV